MSEENTFDCISRLLATPIPRRQALKLALGLVTSTAASSFLQGASWGDPNKNGSVGAKKQPLDYPITNLSLNDVQAYNVIKALEYQYQVPVSFIDASEKTEDTPYNPAKPNAPQQLIAVGHPLLTFDIKTGTARNVLDQLVKQDPTYQYGMVEGRLIVYPKQPKFETIVSGIDIRNEPRSEAAVNYVFRTLAKRVKGFEDYGTAIGGYIGGTDSPIYKDPITLSSQGTVLSQLAQLLGSDPSIVFIIIRNSSGTNIFQFDTVGPQPPFKPLELILPKSSTGEGSEGAHDNIANVTAAATSTATCRPTNIVYGARQSSTQSTDGCGVTDIYAVTGITICSGDDCTGQTETESATQQTANSSKLPTCNPGSGTPRTGGCGSIYNKSSFMYTDPQGNIRVCGDQYGAPGLTGANYSKPGYMCQDTFTQTVSVSGSPVNPFAQATMVFTRSIDKNGVCTASITAPSFSSLVTCCGLQAGGTDPYTLCPYTLCTNATQACVSDNGTANAICCPTGDTAACNQVCCQPGATCFTDKVTGNMICCPSGTSVACNGTCCPAGNTCTNGNCCPSGQATSDNKLCCPSGQSPQGTICCPTGQINANGICCPTGQTNCKGTCCANTCCNGVCCSAGQTCINNVCCGQPSPQNRMSAEEVKRGWYATDDLSVCCAPGHPPCGNVCCPSGSVCCDGSCCAGTCDSTGACIPPPNENK